jgi:hypothetical protein
MSMDRKQLVKLLSYMSTFDGGLYKTDRGNAYFVLNMRKENLDYIQWVASVLSEVTGVVTYDRKDYNTDGYNRQPQVRLESKRHPFLTKLHSRIYMDNHKVLCPHMLTLMDAEALAIIFMADGGSSLDLRSKNPHVSLSLNTKGFSYSDNMALSKAIYSSLGIHTTLQRHNQYWYLRIPTKDVLKFVSIVEPYVLPSFHYKLARIAPGLEHLKSRGGDIVCSSGQPEVPIGNSGA